MRSVADLCDEYADAIAIMSPLLVHYGGTRRFSGRAVTVRVERNNGLVKDLLSENGCGKILVISAGGQTSEAVVGDKLASSAIANSWEGLIIDGMVRDVREIVEMAIGVVALGAFPRRGVGGGPGVADVRVSVGGVEVDPGNWIYADLDGIVVSPVELS